MNKLLIASLVAVSVLAACGQGAEPSKSSTSAAPKTSAAASTTDAPKTDAVKPQIVAPKPPPPPGGGASAPELKPEDIARIQEMLKKRDADQKAAAATAATPKK